MKISKYTFCLEWDDGDFYLFNTLSNALIQIDEETFGIIKQAQAHNVNLNGQELDVDLWQVLKEKTFITENDKDDFLIYKSMIMPLRNQKKFMHLTLAPTMECNFRCFYCFESEKPKGKMSSEVMDAIVKYISSLPELKKIYLTWFGGEPLLAVPQMELFYEKLRAVYDKDIDSNIITTGFHLTKDIIPVLQKLQISSVQITLDGNKERHNKIKHTSECEDVFSKVLKNIDDLTRKVPPMEVIFRINITKENAQEYIPLYHYLYDRFGGKNISVAPGFVADRTNTGKKNYFFKREEITRFILDLWNSHHIYTPWLRYPKAICSECAIRDQRAISFDSEGYVYKCWEMIGMRKHAIGKINGSGEITNINRVLLNRQLYGADPIDDHKCQECAYLPICDGGCPIQRIQNEYENANNDVCTTHINNLKDFIRIHVALTKDGFDNH